MQQIVKVCMLNLNLQHFIQISISRHIFGTHIHLLNVVAGVYDMLCHILQDRYSSFHILYIYVNIIYVILYRYLCIQLMQCTFQHYIVRFGY